MGEVAKVENSNVVALSDNSPMRLIEMALAKDGVELDKLERFFDMQERWEKKEAKRAFQKALAVFQKVCPRIVKKKQAHNYKYAPLPDIVEQIRPALDEAGLTYRFEQAEENGLIAITCIITHLDGHSESTKMTGEDDASKSKSKIQAKGSTVTYLQRYTLIGALGIVTADEDIDGRLPPKPVELITEKQALELQASVESKDYPMDLFLNNLKKAVKVEHISDIPASQLTRVQNHVDNWSAE